MAVITDWRDGRIQGWMDAPRLEVAADGDTDVLAIRIASKVMPDRKEIVKEWAEEFKLEGLWGDDSKDDEMMQQ